MNTNLAIKDGTAVAIMEQLVIGGDLSRLSSAERLSFYKATCESLGLNPLTKPFEYITLNGKLTLYARKDCTEQLRKINGVSIPTVERELVEGIFICTAHATDKTGRSDTSIGAVPIDHLKGEARANAMMKAETKSKRRVTLSICGLGMLDETEIETIPDAKPFVEPKEEKKKAVSTPVERELNHIEMDLAKSCLIEVMKADCFMDRDREKRDDWFRTNPSLAAVKKALREKQEWAEAWKKEQAASSQNPDADAPPAIESSEAF